MTSFWYTEGFATYFYLYETSQSSATNRIGAPLFGVVNVERLRMTFLCGFGEERLVKWREELGMRTVCEKYEMGEASCERKVGNGLKKPSMILCSWELSAPGVGRLVEATPRIMISYRLTVQTQTNTNEVGAGPIGPNVKYSWTYNWEKSARQFKPKYIRIFLLSAAACSRTPAPKRNLFHFSWIVSTPRERSLLVHAFISRSNCFFFNVDGLYTDSELLMGSCGRGNKPSGSTND